MDFSEEKEPTRRVLLDEGWREFKILSVEDTTSKAGNHMFIFTVLDIETDSEDKIYAVAEKGKRWFLKSLLSAVGIKDNEGEFTWDIPDVVDQKFQGEVRHEDNEWVNREGETIKSKQHRIVSVKASGVAWDE
jgi:DNA-binding PadR family transcriptional regulator